MADGSSLATFPVCRSEMCPKPHSFLPVLQAIWLVQYNAYSAARFKCTDADAKDASGRLICRLCYIPASFQPCHSERIFTRSIFMEFAIT
jgi:hypothetical protein